MLAVTPSGALTVGSSAWREWKAARESVDFTVTGSRPDDRLVP